MSVTTNLSITKLDVGQVQKEATINAALDTLDAFLGNGPTARVYHNTTQSISDSTVTAVSLNSERFDTDTIHDNSTNNSRLTCKTAGKYLIIANVGFASNATGYRSVAIRLNGSTYIASTQVTAINGATTRLAPSTLYALAVNDYVEAIVFQTSGGALNTEQSGNITPEFMMKWTGA